MPSCAGSQLPAAGAVTAAAQPLVLPSRQLPPRDVPSCVSVCVSKRISSPPSLRRAGGTGRRRPAAEWLPVHTLWALTPPTPPLLLLALSLLSQLLLQLPLPSSQRQWRNRSEKGGEGWGKKRRCLQWRDGRTRQSSLLQGFRQRKGRRGFTQRKRSCCVPPGTAGQLRGRERGGCAGLQGGLRSLLGEPAEETRVAEPRGHRSQRHSITEFLRPVSLG